MFCGTRSPPALETNKSEFDKLLVNGLTSELVFGSRFGHGQQRVFAICEHHDRHLIRGCCVFVSCVLSLLAKIELK